jgi:hypothetical protein
MGREKGLCLMSFCLSLGEKEYANDFLAGI